MYKLTSFFGSLTATEDALEATVNYFGRSGLGGQYTDKSIKKQCAPIIEKARALKVGEVMDCVVCGKVWEVGRNAGGCLKSRFTISR